MKVQVTWNENDVVSFSDDNSMPNYLSDKGNYTHSIVIVIVIR